MDELNDKLPAAAGGYQPCAEDFTSAQEVICSFCGASQAKSQRMVIAPKEQFVRAAICDECICACLGILEDEGFVVEPSKTGGCPTPQAEKD